MSFISFLDGAVAGAAPSASSTTQFLSTIVPFVLIIGIFYFFLIRPQNKKQKETEKMIAALKKGDKVVTIGGIHGVVSSTKEKTVIVKVDDNCKIEFSRSAIAGVENEKPAESKKDETKSEEATSETK
ncbi:MAG: preprotein translocase subunit YajC [Treponema sp.]|nr:preprotein translocase subunit YajC [Treponema sp.]